MKEFIINLLQKIFSASIFGLGKFIDNRYSQGIISINFNRHPGEKISVSMLDNIIALAMYLKARKGLAHQRDVGSIKKHYIAAIEYSYFENDFYISCFLDFIFKVSENDEDCRRILERVIMEDKIGSPEVYLYYATSLISCGREKEAKVYVDKVISLYPEFPIYKFGYILHLIDNPDEKVKKHLRLIRHINRSRAEFLEFINGKSICVVGNSPKELGNSLGHIIDAHDIVARFNNFSTEKEYVKDYGKRTNIWVRGVNNDVKERKGFDFIVFTKVSLYCNRDHDIELLLKYMAHDRVIVEDNRKRGELIQKSGILRPSTGLSFSYFISSMREGISRLTYKGFSFTDVSRHPEEQKHYFKPKNDGRDRKEGTAHCWDREKVFFENNIAL